MVFAFLAGSAAGAIGASAAGATAAGAGATGGVGVSAGVVAAVAWTSAPGAGKVETSGFAPELIQVNTTALPPQEFVDRSLVFVNE